MAILQYFLQDFLCLIFRRPFLLLLAFPPPLTSITKGCTFPHVVSIFSFPLILRTCSMHCSIVLALLLQFIDFSPPRVMLSCLILIITCLLHWSYFLYAALIIFLFFVFQSYQRVTSADTTPSFSLRYSNGSLARGFVNISVVCSLVGTYSNFTNFCATFSPRKWYFTQMWFFFNELHDFLIYLLHLYCHIWQK